MAKRVQKEESFSRDKASLFYSLGICYVLYALAYIFFSRIADAPLAHFIVSCALCLFALVLSGMLLFSRNRSGAFSKILYTLLTLALLAATFFLFFDASGGSLSPLFLSEGFSIDMRVG